VIGRPEGAARAALEGAGFEVEISYRPVDDESDAGKVIRQDPPAGTPAAEGSVVSIVVGRRSG
jgi:beta-lactam-binding protein with PASTA domain